MKKKILALVAFVCCAGALTAQQPSIMASTEPGWHKIGSRTVDFKTEREEIAVLGADRFSAIKFQVTEAPIDLIDLEIWTENGTKQDVHVRTPIEIGKSSRVINIDGGAQDIYKIVFVYKTLPNRKDEKAEVVLYGLKPEKDMAVRTDKSMNSDRMDKSADRPATGKKDNTVPQPAIEVSDKSGWHKIAETTVSFTADRDEVAVLMADRYAKLKFKVTDASITISSIMVSYEDGTKQDVPVQLTFSKGEESRVVDIPGSEKSIKRIGFVYKTLPNQANEKAHVEIWGYKSNADGKTGMNY